MTKVTKFAQSAVQINSVVRSVFQQSLLTLSQPSSAVSGLWMLTMLRPRTWASEGDKGLLATLDFENFSKKDCFLSFE